MTRPRPLLPHRPDSWGLWGVGHGVPAISGNSVFTQCGANPCYNHKLMPDGVVDTTLIRLKFEMVRMVDTDPRQVIKIAYLSQIKIQKLWVKNWHWQYYNFLFRKNLRNFLFKNLFNACIVNRPFWRYFSARRLILQTKYFYSSYIHCEVSCLTSFRLMCNPRCALEQTRLWGMKIRNILCATDNYGNFNHYF